MLSLLNDALVDDTVDEIILVMQTCSDRVQVLQKEGEQLGRGAQLRKTN
jgi:heme exporter protein D